MNTSKTDDIHSFLDWALKGRSDWWRYVLGILLLVFVFLAGTLLVGLPLIRLFGDYERYPEIGKIAFDNSTFLPVFLAPLFLAWALHKRPWWSVAVPRPRVEWWNLGMGFVLELLGLLGVWLLYTFLGGIKTTFVPHDLLEYIPVVVVSFFFIFIQITAEELVFRGYLMQALRRITANPIFIIGVTGVLFGAPHLPNLGPAGLPWYGLLIYMMDGWLLAWLAYRTRSLWMSIGWHWANNFSSFIILSASTLTHARSIFIIDIPSVEFTLLIKTIILLPIVFIINRVVSRREKADG